MLEVALLGTGGVMPLPHRYLTSLYMRYNSNKLLIDCGEATQVSLRTLDWGYKNLDVICITHYHGDHITGLPGILFNLQNLNRTQKLTIIGPTGLKKVIDSFYNLYGEIPYEIESIEVPMKKQTIKINEFNITAIPVEHKVDCLGYIVEVKRNARFNIEMATKNKVPRKYWKRLQNGEIINENNISYTQNMILGQSRKGIKISYITDTRPTKLIEKAIKKSDLFIAECMYIDNDKLDKVKKNKHMLGIEAAKLAQDSECRELWLTHFSPAIKEEDLHIEPILDIFKNATFGEDRKIKKLKFE